MPGRRGKRCLRHPAGVTPAPYGARIPTRPRPRWKLVLAGALAAGVAALIVLRIPGAAADVRAASARVDGRRLPWLGAALAAEALSLGGSAAAQRRLLAAVGTRLPCWAMFGLALASAGLSSLIPAGQLPATAWLTGQYRRRGAPGALGLWAVVADGFAASVTILALLLTGAAAAGLGSPVLLTAAAVVLIAGSAGFVAAAHRADAVTGWLRAHYPHAHRTRWLAGAAARLSGPRPGYRDGTAVLLLSSMSWLAGAVVLAAAFELAGLAIPWRGLLFAYAASQVGGLVPLPGGLGGVEGGLLGALALAGAPLTAALATAVIVYRVVGYWAVILAGAVAAAAMTSRRLRTPPVMLSGRRIGGDGHAAGISDHAVTQCRPDLG
jgi:uncharacterized membrane protein YbhN (UPF0104 family)